MKNSILKLASSGICAAILSGCACLKPPPDEFDQLKAALEAKRIEKEEENKPGARLLEFLGRIARPFHYP